MTKEVLCKILPGFTQCSLAEIEEAEVLVIKSSVKLFRDQTCFGTRVNSAERIGNL